MQFRRILPFPASAAEVMQIASVAKARPQILLFYARLEGVLHPGQPPGASEQAGGMEIRLKSSSFIDFGVI